MNATQESHAVKRALEAAGYRAQVRHGTGTGSSWLKIRLTGPALPAHEAPSVAQCVQTRCPACVEWRRRWAHARDIACAVTGRHGDYDGRVNVSVECRP